MQKYHSLRGGFYYRLGKDGRKLYYQKSRDGLMQRVKRDRVTTLPNGQRGGGVGLSCLKSSSNCREESMQSTINPLADGMYRDTKRVLQKQQQENSDAMRKLRKDMDAMNTHLESVQMSMVRGNTTPSNTKLQVKRSPPRKATKSVTKRRLASQEHQKKILEEKLKRTPHDEYLQERWGVYQKQIEQSRKRLASMS